MTHQYGSSVYATFLNEIRLSLRDPFCLLILACFSVGLAWASWNSNKQWHSFSLNQSEGTASNRELWLSQPTENAHMATHVGQTVYKPISPLTSFDPGEVSELGTTIVLQAHHQSAAKEKPRQVELALLQTETFSPAVLIQLIGPLLIILLGNASIRREIEGRTLSLILTTGSPWSAILIGKAAAVCLIIFLVSVPGLLLLVAPLFESTPLINTGNLLIRQAILFSALSAYFVGWLGLTFMVSSWSKSTIGSFSILITCWSIIALVLPRIAGDIATHSIPLPSNAEIRLEKENAVHQSNQSSIEKARANRAFENKLLNQFKVERIEDLPIDIAGARMIDQEEMTNRLFDEINSRIISATEQRLAWISSFQYCSPYLAIRTVSASLSATDRAHHFDFESDAENYRRRYVEILNVAEMNKRKPGKTAEEKRQFWAEVPEFAPSFIPAAEALKRSLKAVSCLIFWALVFGVAALYASPHKSHFR